MLYTGFPVDKINKDTVTRYGLDNQSNQQPSGSVFMDSQTAMDMGPHQRNSYQRNSYDMSRPYK